MSTREQDFRHAWLLLSCFACVRFLTGCAGTPTGIATSDPTVLTSTKTIDLGNSVSMGVKE